MVKNEKCLKSCGVKSRTLCFLITFTLFPKIILSLLAGCVQIREAEENLQ